MNVSKEKKAIVAGMVGCLLYVIGDFLFAATGKSQSTESKCDKYVHLGMELAGTHDLGAFGKLYDLIKYPKSAKKAAKQEQRAST